MIRMLIGRTLAYMAARLEPRAGVVLTADDAYQDYLAWCARAKLSPLKTGTFRAELVQAADTVGITLARDTGDTVLVGTALRSHKP